MGEASSITMIFGGAADGSDGRQAVRVQLCVNEAIIAIDGANDSDDEKLKDDHPRVEACIVVTSDELRALSVLFDTAARMVDSQEKERQQRVR